MNLKRLLAGLCAVFVLVAAGCTVALVHFEVPGSVIANDLFEVVVQGVRVSSGVGNGTAGAVVQAPNGFVYQGYVTDLPSGSVVAVDSANILSLYTAEPGHSLKAFAVTGLSSVTDVTLRVRYRAPSSAGTHVFKTSLAAGIGSITIQVPAGVSNFASMTSGVTVQSLSVVPGTPQGLHKFQMDDYGLPSVTTSPGPYGGMDLRDLVLNDGGRQELLVSGPGTSPQIYQHDALFGWTPTTIGLALPSTAASPRFGRFDADAFVDIIAGSTLYHGDGLGGFSTTTLPGAAIPLGATVMVKDVNGDGWDDVATYAGGTVRFFVSGSGGYTEVSQGLPVGGPAIHFLSIADVDGDGANDIVIATTSAANLANSLLHVYFADPGNLWSLPTTFTPSIQGRIRGLSAFDSDGDADIDFVIGAYINLGLQPFSSVQFASRIGVGRASASWSFSNAVSISAVTTGISAIELNGRGAPEVLVGSFGTARVLVRRANGTWDTAPWSEAGLEFSGPSSANSPGQQAIGDVNGDGVLDWVGSTEVGAYCRLGVGAGTLLLRGGVASAVGLGPADVLSVGNSAVPNSETTEYRRVISGTTITIKMETPPTGTSAPFILWGQLSAPSSATSVPLPIGTMAIRPLQLFPTDPLLVVIANSFDPFDPLSLVGGATVTPWLLSFPTPPGLSLRITLQGVMLDPTAPVLPLSITNAITFDVL